MWRAGRIRQTAQLPTMILRRFITCCISQNILSEKGKENKISLLKMPGVHAIITIMSVSGKNNLPRERKPTKVGYLFPRLCQKYYDAGRAPLCGKIITEKKIGW